MGKPSMGSQRVGHDLATKAHTHANHRETVSHMRGNRQLSVLKRKESSFHTEAQSHRREVTVTGRLSRA